MASIQQGEVGTTYHVGIGTTDGAGVLTAHGYMLKAGTSLVRKSDLQARSTLISSSPNLSDRDLVKNPRITVGNFAGGGLQQVFIDPKKYWDSDMEIRTPGSLTARPRWYRKQEAAGIVRGTGNPQAVIFSGDVWATFNETNGAVYNSTASSTVAAGPVTQLDSDGVVLFAVIGASIYFYNGVVWSLLFTAVGTIDAMWAINLGTAGRFIYFTIGLILYRYDIVAQVGTGDLVPTGTMNTTIVDVVPYGGAVAIILNSLSMGTSVWYHDGLNMQLVLRLSGYRSAGMTNCLGNLWIVANPVGNNDSPILAQIGNGQFDIVAQLGLPGVGNCIAGAPCASSEFVSFAITAPTINGVSPAGYIAVYDALTQAYSHLGNYDGGDMPGTTPRSLCYMGRSMFSPQLLAGNAVMQYQGNQAVMSPNGGFQATSQMVSSKIDFNTPGIGKMFRRIMVHHAPLRTGEAIQIKAYIDQDPMTYPASSTATSAVNGTAGSTVTVLVFPKHTTGFSMYFSLIVTATATTTPCVFYVATEVTVPWTFEMTLDCSTKRRTLEGQEDPQGLLGQDLFYFLKDAWEEAYPITYWDADGSAYIVEMQEMTTDSQSPMAGKSNPTRAQDYESYVTLILAESVV